MIPRIKTGRSFKGAALYYLHDKESSTTRRVAWTYAVNTLENEPKAVFAEMQRTALNQATLKIMSGNRVDGRPTGDTVMTIALAWSPTQSPDQDHMIETGRSFLRHMGWHEHEALFVGHNDTRHPHFHIILNRVHPETGMTLDDAWAKNRAQRWAFRYERENGLILCLNREAKYGRGENSNSHHPHHGEWKARRDFSNDNTSDADHAPEKDEWTTLKESQREERQAFWKETAAHRRELRASIRDGVRKEFAPEWQAYAVHKAERDEAARRFDQETRRAIRHYRRLHGPDAVRKLKERQKYYHKQQREELKAARAAINARMKERTEELAAPALTKLADQRRAQYEEVLQRQREGRAELHEKTDAQGEKSEKQIEQEARRQARIDQYIAQRKIDRERDRGDGGRER